MSQIGNELEELELIALGRIPRCMGCPRYAAMLTLHVGGHPWKGDMPAVPLYCSHQVCAPLAVRLSSRACAAGAPPSDLPLAG
jgi:hypothetical protein